MLSLFAIKYLRLNLKRYLLQCNAKQSRIPIRPAHILGNWARTILVICTYIDFILIATVTIAYAVLEGCSTLLYRDLATRGKVRIEC